MTKAATLAVMLMIPLAGCMRTHAPELAAPQRIAPHLINTAPATGTFPPEQWPEALKAVDPERVYATPDGLYIVTWSFFVQEKGLFLPRSAAFAPPANGDPRYTPITAGVYAYSVQG